MSYIAKIYLKKMFKPDAFKIEGDYLKITVNNVISPLDVQKVPEDSPNEHFELIDENGKVIAGKGNIVAWEKFKVEAHGKQYDKNNYPSMVGVKVDRGEQYIIYVPNPGWKIGESHKLTVKLYQDRPIEFFITFTTV